jgi:hypothetical protein
MATQGKKHMGGTKRYVKQMMNIPASRVGIKAKTPVISKPTTGKSKLLTSTFTNIGTQPTRAMLGLK